MASAPRHRPLDRASARTLVSLADPQGPSEPAATAALEPVVDAARAHGVLPVVARRLQALRRTSLATHASIDLALAKAHDHLIAASGQTQLLTYHARRIAAAIEHARLDATIIKGATFATTLYARTADRSFTDIDVLTSRASVAALGEVLRDYGFVPELAATRADYAEDKWTHPGDDVLLVEVQTDLIHSPNLRAAMRFGYDQLIAAGCGNPRDATAQLMIAAVHGAAGHQFDRLQPVVDVLQAARGVGGPIDAGRLRAVARASGTITAIQTALDLAHDLFGEPAAKTLADALGRAPLRGVRNRLVTPPVVLRAQSRNAAGDSLRRQLLRESFKLGRPSARP